MNKSMVFLLFILGGLLVGSNLPAQTAQQIAAKWKSTEADKPMQLDIYLAQDGGYYGKVINNEKDPAKNGRIAIKNLRYNAAKNHYTGTMNPPDSKMELNVTVTLPTNDQLKIVAKKFLLSKTLYLTRIQSNR